MPLGKQTLYIGPWFRVGDKDQPRERFHARYPTVAEKLDYSDMEQGWFVGGDKPGDVRKFLLRKSQIDGFNTTLPLIEHYEVEGGEKHDGDWVREQLKDAGEYLEEVVALGSFLFRPTSAAGDPVAGGAAGASGVPENPQGQGSEGAADLSRLQ